MDKRGDTYYHRSGLYEAIPGNLLTLAAGDGPTAGSSAYLSTGEEGCSLLPRVGTPVQNGCCLWVRALTRPEKGAFLPLRLLNWGARPYSQARAPLGERSTKMAMVHLRLISCVVSTLVLGWSAGQAIDEEAEWTRDDRRTDVPLWRTFIRER